MCVIGQKNPRDPKLRRSVWKIRKKLQKDVGKLNKGMFTMSRGLYIIFHIFFVNTSTVTSSIDQVLHKFFTVLLTWN